VTSSAYTNYRSAAERAFIRGQSAEYFERMLRTPRSDGAALSFNSVEGSTSSRGLRTLVYGPTGNVGGYAIW